MARCEPWEWPLIPCLCILRDCQMDVSAAYTRSGRQIVQMQAAEELTLGEALVQLEIEAMLADRGYAICVAEMQRCSGTEDSPRPPTKRFTPDQRAAFSDTSGFCWKAAGVAAFATLAIPAGFLLVGAGAAVAVGLGVALGVGALGFTWMAVDFGNLAVDPPDREVDTIAQPDPPRPPIIVPEAEISGSLADALNAVLANQAAGVGLGRAVVTALNRSGSAEVMGNLIASNRQLEASRTFAGEWSNILEDAGTLRSEAARQLAHLGIGGSGVAALDAIRLRGDILDQGWPQTTKDMMDLYGIRGTQQEEVLRRMTISLNDLPALSSSPIELIEAQALVQHEAKAADALRAFTAG